MGVRQKVVDGGRPVREPVDQRKSRVPALVGIAGTLLVAGCTTSGGTPPRSSPAASSSTSVVSAAPTTSATPTVDPRAQPAIAAFSALQAAAVQAFLHPFDVGAPMPSGADFSKYSFDPLRAELSKTVATLHRGKLVFGGTAPRPRIVVKSIELSATPYPRVILDNCPVQDSSWRVFNKDTGRPAPQPSSEAPPPYLATFTVILVDGRWGVSASTVDASRTCTP